MQQKKKTTTLLTGLLFPFFFLSGCGFSPLYQGDRSSTRSVCLTVKGDGYTAYKFRRELEKQLALIPFDNQDYKLNVILSETKSAATYAQDATITRSQVTASARYELKKNGKSFVNYADEITTSYPVTPSDEFITRNADHAASTRAAISLAEEVARNISRLLQTQGQDLK